MLLNGNMYDYKVPTILDQPKIEPVPVGKPAAAAVHAAPPAWRTRTRTRASWAEAVKNATGGDFIDMVPPDKVLAVLRKIRAMKHYKHQQAASAKEAAIEHYASGVRAHRGRHRPLGHVEGTDPADVPRHGDRPQDDPDMDIAEDSDAVRIGALAKLADVADSDAVKNGCAAGRGLRRAASPVAT